ncbi:hypothetical protein HOLleu_28088 [Holothuria leucospilota]|uniref:Uncharacterized protein n=1 Tax=Holothuria leucospilota TaxID=206669 RepID=A0A9Q1BLV9_HOLLE|nr:hypothetical protein HOLleu_28088 [Holothuria leucospilota]
MDRRHYLESQRSHLSAHQGLPGTSFPSPQIRGRPPISPILRSPIPHQSPPPLHSERFPAAVFSGRIQPHLAPIGQASHHLLERQRELKEASLIQAKLAQQRAATHMISNHVNHPAGEERVQYVPAVQPNMTPEDSLAQLRRLHQQVLSMPSHDPQYFDMSSASLPGASRSREVSRDLQETAKLLRLATQERMIMEQHMLNSKQQIAEQGGFAHLMEESLPCKSAGSMSPFVVPHQTSSPPVSRPTATRPPVLPCPNTISHEVNLRLQQKLAAENSRRIQELEKQQLQGDYSKRTALYPHKQKQIPSPNAVVIPHNIPQRSGHNYRSLVRPAFFKGIDNKLPHVRPELRPELPHHNVFKQTIPQIKDVRSLKIESEGGSLSRIDQRDVLLKMMEHRIKQELDKEDDSYSSSRMSGNRPTDEMQNSSMIKVPLSHSPSSTTPSTPDRPIKEEPPERSKRETFVPTDLSISSCQTSQALSVSENKPLRKRPIMADTPPSPTTKRSRGAGDIFKARLADFNAIVTSSRPAAKDDPVSSSHVSTISETFSKQTSEDDSLDQPLDLSVPASQNFKKHEPELKQVSPVHREAKPLKSPSDQSEPCNRIPMKTTTISEIISEAVIASLDRPSTVPKNIGVPTCKTEEVTPIEEDSVAKLQSSTSTRAEYVSGVSDSDAESSSACEEDCQRQLIDVLSSQFAGSFRNFLVSLLRECKNDSIVKALAISKAGQRVPILMKEELERCNAKISQTIRTLLENDDEKESLRMVKRNETNCEGGIDKDTSPPCQVSTTTDIWQHSPPVSPPGCLSKTHGTVAKSQGDDSVKDLGNAKQFEEGNVPDEIMGDSGVKDVKDETKMPLIMKIESLASSCDEEEISCADVALEVGDRDSISDVPLFIDDGFINMSPPEGQTEIESGKPNEVQRKVEEDAIDLLKFGNDEIDLDENEVCEDKDQSQKEDLQFERTEGSPMLELLETKPQSDEENSFHGKESSRPVHQTLDVDNSAERNLTGETSSDRGNEMTPETSVTSFSRCAINEGSSAMSAGKGTVSASRVITNAAVGHNSTNVSGVSSGDCKMTAGAVQSKYQQILPKQSTSHTTVVAPEQQTPLSIVSPPITIALPKVYQIDPVPSTQFLQIIPSPVTSNIVGPLATPVNGTPVPSVTISSLVAPGKETLMPTIQPTPSQTSVIVSTVTSASSTNMKQVVTSLASPTTTPSAGFSHNASAATSTSSYGSTYTSNGKVPIPPLSRVTPPGMKVNHGSSPLMWKGNVLIPHNSPQETTNPKKPFVPAYTVVYHTAHLPCVVRSSVPFVPPKILWKSLFMSVTFTDFNKTLSICSILQRYMTVLEQAALQKDLTSNGISSCKLVPLDEFDSKYQDVEEQLAKISTGSPNSDNSHI